MRRPSTPEPTNAQILLRVMRLEEIITEDRRRTNDRQQLNEERRALDAERRAFEFERFELQRRVALADSRLMALTGESVMHSASGETTPQTEYPRSQIPFEDVELPSTVHRHPSDERSTVRNRSTSDPEVPPSGHSSDSDRPASSLDHSTSSSSYADQERPTNSLRQHTDTQPERPTSSLRHSFDPENAPSSPESYSRPIRPAVSDVADSGHAQSSVRVFSAPPPHLDGHSSSPPTAHVPADAGFTDEERPSYWSPSSDDSSVGVNDEGLSRLLDNLGDDECAFYLSSRFRVTRGGRVRVWHFTSLMPPLRSDSDSDSGSGGFNNTRPLFIRRPSASTRNTSGQNEGGSNAEGSSNGMGQHGSGADAEDAEDVEGGARSEGEHGK